MSPNERNGRRDLVVVGGSAGAIQALRTMLGGLPAHYQGTILIVVHTAADSPAMLDTILSKVTSLPCRYATDGEYLESGRIYLARPDRHLTVEDNRVRVAFGPKQNWHRPAINPLFVSAAQAHGRRVCGIVLSGMLDDGTIGLMAIQEAGGVAIVQSPQDALFPAMPQNALQFLEADYIAPVAEIPDILMALAQQPGDERRAPTPTALDEEGAEEEIEMASGMHSEQERKIPTCPECGGVLAEERTANALHYSCFLGHGYTPDVLWNDQITRVEQALWLALRIMEESVALGHRLAAEARREGNADRLVELSGRLEKLERDAGRVRAILYEEAG